MFDNFRSYNFYEDRTRVSPTPETLLGERSVPLAPLTSLPIFWVGESSKKVSQKRNFDTEKRSRSGFYPSFMIIICMLSLLFLDLYSWSLCLQKNMPAHEKPSLPRWFPPLSRCSTFSSRSRLVGRSPRILLGTEGTGGAVCCLGTPCQQPQCRFQKQKKHLESGAIQQDHLFNRCWTRPHKWQQGYDDPNMMSVMDGIWANSSGFTKLKSLAVWGWLADILTSIDGAWSACEAVILESWQNFGMIFMTDSMIYGQNMLKSLWFMVKLEKIPCFHKTRLRLWTDRFELHHRWFGLASPTFSIIFPCHPILKCKPWLNLSLLV